MQLTKALKLMEKYAVCPECGSDKLGGDAGTLQIDGNLCRRTCGCGWKIELDITKPEEKENCAFCTEPTLATFRLEAVNYHLWGSTRGLLFACADHEERAVAEFKKMFKEDVPYQIVRWEHGFVKEERP